MREAAFSFYNRNTGESVRLVLKKKPDGMTREESFAYYQSCEPKDMFEVKEIKSSCPSRREFLTLCVDCCGETTGANWIRLQESKNCAWTAIVPIPGLTSKKGPDEGVWALTSAKSGLWDNTLSSGFEGKTNGVMKKAG